MNWRATAFILVAFAAAALAMWCVPPVFGLAGLDAFVFVGQICFVVLALSVADVVFARIAPADR